MVTKSQPSTPGERIAARRKEIPKYKRSQEALAEDVGVTRTTVSAWENDKFPPEGENLMKLSRCLGVTAEWVIRGPTGRHLRVAESGPGYASFMVAGGGPDEAGDGEGGSPAEQLIEYLSVRVGYRRVVGELTDKDLIAAAYTLARRHGFGPDEFKKIDHWRDEILGQESKG